MIRIISYLKKGSIIIGGLTTIKSLDNWSTGLLYYYEIFATSYFFCEFVLRVWSSGHGNSYNGAHGCMKFLRRPLILIELSVIVISISVLSFSTVVPYVRFVSTDRGNEYQYFNPKALLLLRFFQILRFFYIDR